MTKGSTRKDNDMKKLLHINPVLRTSTSTGRIIQEIGAVAIKEVYNEKAKTRKP